MKAFGKSSIEQYTFFWKFGIYIIRLFILHSLTVCVAELRIRELNANLYILYIRSYKNTLLI